MDIDSRNITWSELREGVRAASGRSLTIRLCSQAACLEVEDAFFNHASAVLLPHIARAGLYSAEASPFSNDALWREIETAHPDLSPRLRDGEFLPEPFVFRDAGLLSLARALVFAQENDRRLMVFGHTDTSGADAYNKRLSEARATIVVALLLGDRDSFCRAVEAFNDPTDEAAVLRYAARTRGWDCEVPDDEGSSPSEDDVKGFQTGFNDADIGAQLTVDGKIGPKTRAAWFDLFESDMEWFAGGELAALRGGLRWVDDSKRYVGCGEAYPIEEAARDDFRSQSNRRVELIFFDPFEAGRLGDAPERVVYEGEGFHPRIIAPESITLNPGSHGDRKIPEFDTGEAEAPAAGVGEPDEELETEAPSPEYQHEDPWDFLEAFDQALPLHARGNVSRESLETGT